MIAVENDCCDCASESYPCRGSSCPMRRVEHYYCDKCKVEVEEGELFEVYGQDLCNDCLMDMFRKSR